MIGNRGPDSQKWFRITNDHFELLEEVKGIETIGELVGVPDSIIGFSSVLHLRGSSTN